jgi:hypothetical protein
MPGRLELGPPKFKRRLNLSFRAKMNQTINQTLAAISSNTKIQRDKHQVRNLFSGSP